VRLTTSLPSVIRLSRKYRDPSTYHNAIDLHGLLREHLLLKHKALQFLFVAFTAVVRVDIDTTRRNIIVTLTECLQLS
jgi:hypothetical protein